MTLEPVLIRRSDLYVVQHIIAIVDSGADLVAGLVPVVPTLLCHDRLHERDLTFSAETQSSRGPSAKAEDLLNHLHDSGCNGGFSSSALVGTGRNDSNFLLQLVDCLSQQLVLKRSDASGRQQAPTRPFAVTAEVSVGTRFSG
jgi:hypothetical protein